jgi:hypothetical protein
VSIKKTDAMKQIVYGEVYAPNEIDSHEDMMTADEIENMAHKFMRLDLSKAIDENHDNVPVAAYPVESWVVKNENDPDYSEGAWVLGVKVEDRDLWDRIEKGEINGFSLEAMVNKETVQVEVSVMKDYFGYTEDTNDHEHAFYVELNEFGKIVRGETDVVNGHSHLITRSSATESTDNHSHRFFLS